VYPSFFHFLCGPYRVKGEKAFNSSKNFLFFLLYTLQWHSRIWSCRITCSFFINMNYPAYTDQSEWPRGLRHELPSLARTLESWVWIPVEAWMSMCVYSVFVLVCVQVAALRRADPPSKQSYRLCKKIKQLKKRPRSTAAVEPQIDR
jgi:hypothetical protein